MENEVKPSLPRRGRRSLVRLRRVSSSTGMVELLGLPLVEALVVANHRHYEQQLERCQGEALAGDDMPLRAAGRRV